MPWELDGEEVQQPPVVNNVWGVMGWLAPDGNFYPCEHTGADMSSFWHVRKARQIMHHLYPGKLEYDPIYLTDNAQSFLHDNGWIRIDIEQVDFWCIPTQAQLDRLFDLTKKVHGYFPKEAVLKILMWRGFKFLGTLSEADEMHMWVHYVPTELWPEGLEGKLVLDLMVPDFDTIDREPDEPERPATLTIKIPGRRPRAEAADDETLSE